MLQLPEIYAENIHRWLPELLYYVADHAEDRRGRRSCSPWSSACSSRSCARRGTARSRRFAVGYIEVARGLPIVVVLYIVYFVPPQLFPGLDWSWFNDFTGAVVGLGLHGGAHPRRGVPLRHRGPA